MRLLADENVPRLVVEFMCSCGYDVIWVGKEASGVPENPVNPDSDN